MNSRPPNRSTPRRLSSRDLELARWHCLLLRYAPVIRLIVNKGETAESVLHRLLLIPVIILLVLTPGLHQRPGGVSEWLPDLIESVSAAATATLLIASHVLRAIRKFADPGIDKDREKGFPKPDQAVELERQLSKEQCFEDCPSDSDSKSRFLKSWTRLGLEAFAFHSPLNDEARYTTYQSYARNPRGITLIRAPARYLPRTAPPSATHIGFVCSFLVSPQQFDELRKGTLSPYDLDSQQLPEEPDSPEQPLILYIQGLYLRSRARRALTANLEDGYQWLARVALIRSILRVVGGTNRPLYIFALAASDKGSVMLQHLGFVRTCKADTGTARYWIYELDVRLLIPPQTPAGINTSRLITQLRAYCEPKVPASPQCQPTGDSADIAAVTE